LFFRVPWRFCHKAVVVEDLLWFFHFPCCLYFVLARSLQLIHRPDIFPSVIFPERRTPGRDRRAFTLIEISVVIAVLVILLLAGVSLLGGTGASARKAGADMLTGMLEQARTSAITSRSYVVLAIAEPGDLPTSDERCRIGLFKIKPDEWPDNAAGAIPAVLMSRWRLLENGVVIIGGEVDGLANAMDGPKLAITYGPAGRTRTLEVRCIAFNPRGGLHHPAGSTPIVLRIAEGGYRGGVATPNRRADSNTISENRIKIGRVTARPFRIDG
jgi:prepilin-type N-terminal cleavage/methylation domain-containing protein